MTNKTNYDLSTFSKEGKIEDVKIGTKIWYHQDGDESDIGIVMVDGGYYVGARWDSGTSQTLHKEGFNCYWGIVMNNKQEQKRHKYYDVILHWANGGKIQHSNIELVNWVDFYTSMYAPNFDSDLVKWRIKPEIKTLRYRNALLKNNEVVVLTSEPTFEDAYGDTAFLRWIDPEWKEIEVEI